MAIFYTGTIAEEIKDQSDTRKLLSKQIVQIAEDFDQDGIQNWPMTWIHANYPGVFKLCNAIQKMA